MDLPTSPCAVELLRPADLRPYSRNARTHSRRQVKEIARSIERFGFTNPVLVDDGNGIIAGHGRVEAAKLLDLQTVPVLRLSHLSAAERQAYVIADNRLAEKAGWDREILAIELQSLIDLSFDVELTAFATAEVDLLLEDVANTHASPTGPQDDIPKLQASTVSRPGDMWAMGVHRLLCGRPLRPLTMQRCWLATGPRWSSPIRPTTFGSTAMSAVRGGSVTASSPRHRAR